MFQVAGNPRNQPGLHAYVGEIERRGDRDHEADPEGDPGRHEFGAPKRHHGNKHIGIKIDHQIEDGAVDRGGSDMNARCARQGAVDPIDQERRSEPGEAGGKIAVDRGVEREQRHGRPGRGEHMDGESGRPGYAGRPILNRHALPYPPPSRQASGRMRAQS